MVSLETLSRAELQVLAKQHGVKANLKNADLIEQLSAVLKDSDKPEAAVAAKEPELAKKAGTDESSSEKKKGKKVASIPDEVKQGTEVQSEKEAQSIAAVSKTNQASDAKEERASAADLSKLGRPELQAMAKTRGIKCNQKTEKLIELLAESFQQQGENNGMDQQSSEAVQEADGKSKNKAAVPGAAAESVIDDDIKCKKPSKKAAKSTVPEVTTDTMPLETEQAEVPKAKPSKGAKGRKSVVPKEQPEPVVAEEEVAVADEPKAKASKATKGRKSVAPKGKLAELAVGVDDDSQVEVGTKATPTKSCRKSGAVTQAENAHSCIRGDALANMQEEIDTCEKPAPQSSSKNNRRASNKRDSGIEVVAEASKTPNNKDRRASNKRNSTAVPSTEGPADEITPIEKASAVANNKNRNSTSRRSSKVKVVGDKACADLNNDDGEANTKAPSRHSLALAHAGKKRKRGHAVKDEEDVPRVKKVRTGRSNKSLGGRASQCAMLGKAKAAMQADDDDEEGDHDDDVDVHTTRPDQVVEKVNNNNSRKSAHGAKSGQMAGAMQSTDAGVHVEKSAKKTKKSLAQLRKSGAADVPVETEGDIQSGGAGDAEATLDRRAQVWMYECVRVCGCKYM